MESKNSYFTPNIEDMRVGYECEANPKFYSEQEDVWSPIIMKGIGQEVIHYHSLGVYRTPYLTKEQIEAEGWKIKTDNNNGVIDFEKTNYLLLSWNYTLKIIEINDGKTTTRFDNQLYRGQCKDINTFRYICKLLGI
jgi:hypothetical protein